MASPFPVVSANMHVCNFYVCEEFLQLTPENFFVLLFSFTSLYQTFTVSVVMRIRGQVKTCLLLYCEKQPFFLV